MSVAGVVSRRLRLDGYYDVKRDFGAKANGVSDDTAAIQDAIDAAFAAPTRIPVVLPAGSMMFTNLTFGATNIIRGASMSATKLKRLPGSTGDAMRQKTTAEGNSSGATGVWLRDFHLDGGGAAGNGLVITALGGQTPINFFSGVENVGARAFSSGTGIDINSNATRIGHLWSNENLVGIACRGGFNSWYGLWAEANTSEDLHIYDQASAFYGIQTETASGVNPIVISGNDNVLFGAFSTAATGIGDVITLAAGTARNAIFFAKINGSGYTNGIYVTSDAYGTGNSTTYIPWFVQGAGATSYNYKLSVADDLDTLTYGASVSVNMNTGPKKYLSVTNTTAFTVNAPVNPHRGQELQFDIKNNGGGVMGAITWNAVFKLTGAFTNPAVGKRRLITFYYDGASWIETNRTAADI